MIPDELCQFNNPNMYMYSLHADLAEKRKDTVTPYVIINLSSTEHLYLLKKHVVAFAEKDNTDGEVFEIGCPSEHGKCLPSSPPSKQKLISIRS